VSREMAEHKTKKCPNCGRETVVHNKWSSCQWCHYWPLYRHLRDRTKKCPNCGRETVIENEWSSCQWCHYWPLFKHLPEIEGERAPWRLSRKLIGAYVVIAVVLVVLSVFYVSSWKPSDFVQLALGQWPEWLLAVLMAFALLILFHFAVWYLGTKIRPEFLVGALFIVGILLLVLTDKQSLYYEGITSWIGRRWDLNFFTASLTVFSLAFAFAGLIRIGKAGK
jgi:ribosomal protein S27AE